MDGGCGDVDECGGSNRFGAKEGFCNNQGSFDVGFKSKPPAMFLKSAFRSLLKKMLRFQPWNDIILEGLTLQCQ